MRSVYNRRMIFLAMLLVMGLSACAPQAVSTPPAMNQPGLSVEATQAPITPTANTGPGASAAIPCDQLIPPDEAGTLMTGLSPVLSEQRGQDETTCTWQYASRVSGQAADLVLQARYGASAVEDWTAARQSELTGQSSDLTLIQIDGLGNENYTWTLKPGNQMVVYVRRGAQTLTLRFSPSDILFLGNESGIIDMTDRVFNRMNP